MERVYRPRKLDRAHPRELLECAFDIVIPISNSLLPDAEAIYTVSEVVQEFSALQVTHHFTTSLLGLGKKNIDISILINSHFCETISILETQESISLACFQFMDATL